MNYLPLFLFSILIIGITNTNTDDTCALRIEGDNLTIQNVFNNISTTLPSMSMIDVITNNSFSIHSTIPGTS